MCMFLWLAPLIIIVLGLLTIIVIVARKFPHIIVLDVDTIKEERTKRLKERIILERFDRFRSQKLGNISKLARDGWTVLSKTGRRLVQRLYKLEQYYKRLKSPKADSIDLNAVKRLLEQAAELMHQHETIQAEKLFIEVIGHHPKQVDAYEGLGNLYLRNKQFEQARETLKFALRLQPENASVLMSLGQLEGAQENHKEALDYLRQATIVRSKNPKYIDAYIASALAAKQAKDVERGIGLLKEINPENQKIAEFEEGLLNLHKPSAV